MRQGPPMGMNDLPSSPSRPSAFPRRLEALRARVEKRCLEEELLPQGGSAVVACSGGLDSVVMLDLLAGLAPRHGWRLWVAHADHGLRRDSVMDALRVAFLAEERGLSSRVGKVCLDATRVGDSGVEAAARFARYAFLEGARREVGASLVAVAHHRQDQAETVLMGLLQGRITAMAPRQGRLIRPFLGEEKETLIAWASHRRLPFAEDSTNRDPRFLRNRIRRDLLPLLDLLQPGAVAAVARSGERAREEGKILDDLVEGKTTYKTGWLDSEMVLRSPLPLGARALVLFAREAGVSLGFQGAWGVLEEIRRRGTRAPKALLPGGAHLILSPEGWRVEVPERKKNRPPLPP